MIRMLLGVLLAGSAVMGPAAVAEADPAVPQAGSPCSADLADAMTLLPDETTYVVCGQSAAGFG